MELLVWLIGCALVALLGINRRIGYLWSFLSCICLSPLIGLIIILCSKKNATEFIEVDNNHKR